MFKFTLSDSQLTSLAGTLEHIIHDWNQMDMERKKTKTGAKRKVDVRQEIEGSAMMAAAVWTMVRRETAKDAPSAVLESTDPEAFTPDDAIIVEQIELGARNITTIRRGGVESDS